MRKANTFNTIRSNISRNTSSLISIPTRTISSKMTISGSLKDVTKTPAWTTLSLHGGQEPDPINGSRAVPLYQTAAYNFSDAADGASKFAWSKDGYVYTRMGNPTNSVFETRMSMLEGGCGAVATASGHAAQVRFESHRLLSGYSLV